MRRLIFGTVFLLSAGIAAAQDNQAWCGTPSPSAAAAESFVEELRRADLSFIPKAPRAIPLAFHVLHNGRNGKVTREQAEAVVDNLNWAFRDSPFTFYLSQFDSRKNPTWYYNCVFNFKNQKRLRKLLALDVRRHINVYSCKPGISGVLGISTFPPGYPVPGNPGHTYLQGIAGSHRPRQRWLDPGPRAGALSRPFPHLRDVLQCRQRQVRGAQRFRRRHGGAVLFYFDHLPGRHRHLPGPAGQGRRRKLNELCAGIVHGPFLSRTGGPDAVGGGELPLGPGEPINVRGAGK